MPWFIKTEKFTASTEKLTPIKRALYIDEHRLWVSKVRSLGIKIFSGYLVNENHRPGGGGLLIFEEISFQKAKDLQSQFNSEDLMLHLSMSFLQQ